MTTFIQKYGGFFLLFIGILGIVYLSATNNSNEVIALSTQAVVYENTMSTTTKNEVYFVDIKGEVLYPGVYAVGNQMRIADVINMAGGLTIDADVSKINLSKNVYDQMVINIPSSVEEIDEEEQLIYFVDIKGAVAFPGVYPVPQGSRVFEAIAMAGGFSQSADSSRLNLSQMVVDEMVIFVDVLIEEPILQITEFKVYIGGAVLRPSEYYVTTHSTLQDLITKAGGLTEDADTTNLFMQMNLFVGFEIIIPAVNSILPGGTQIESGLVNINTASLDALMSLKGIGMILGQRIIDYRAEFGRFETIEDIMKVSGIKNSIYEDVKDDITV